MLPERMPLTAHHMGPCMTSFSFPTHVASSDAKIVEDMFGMIMGPIIWTGSALPKPPRECFKIWYRAERWQQSLEFSILLGIHLPMRRLCSCEQFWVALTQKCVEMLQVGSLQVKSQTCSTSNTTERSSDKLAVMFQMYTCNIYTDSEAKRWTRKIDFVNGHWAAQTQSRTLHCLQADFGIDWHLTSKDTFLCTPSSQHNSFSHCLLL